MRAHAYALPENRQAVRRWMLPAPASYRHRLRYLRRYLMRECGTYHDLLPALLSTTVTPIRFGTLWCALCRHRPNIQGQKCLKRPNCHCSTNEAPPQTDKRWLRGGRLRARAACGTTDCNGMVKRSGGAYGALQAEVGSERST